MEFRLKKKASRYVFFVIRFWRWRPLKFHFNLANSSFRMCKNVIPNNSTCPVFVNAHAETLRSNLSYVFWRFPLETNTTNPDLSKQNPFLSHRCHANEQTALRIFFFLYTQTQTHIMCVCICYYYRLLFARLVDMNCLCMCMVCAPTVFYTLFNPNIYLTNLITTVAAGEWI